MCFSQEMKDLLPKEIPSEYGKDLQWYLHDLLLSYKYNYKDRFLRDLNYLKPFLSRQIYLLFVDIYEEHFWK